MSPLKLQKEGGEPFSLLVLGAHSDDIEIGCGGTLLKLLKAESDLAITWVVFAALGKREDEARHSAEQFLNGAAQKNIVTFGFRDGYFPSELPRIKDEFEALKESVDPDLILTHHCDDRHQDHRALCELTWNTWRSHLILEYEIPKYDGDLSRPNVYIPLPDDIARQKVELLMSCFATQRSKHWFDEEVFYGLMRLRGMEATKRTRYAEAFHGHKLTLG